MRYHFDDIFGSASSGVLLVDKYFTIERANEAICELLGYTKNELITRQLADLVYQEPYEEGNSLQSICSTSRENTIELEKRLIKYDKSLVWVHFCLHSSYDEETDSWYGLVIVTDISYRKELEAKLKRLQHKQEVVLRQIHEQVKSNMALVQFAERLPWKYITEQVVNPAITSTLTKRVKSASWVYSSLYVREKTSGIHLQKYIDRLVKQIITFYPDNGFVRKINLSIEPVYVSAPLLNVLTFIVHELLDIVLSVPQDAHIQLSFGKEPGEYSYLFSWQCKTKQTFSEQELFPVINLISMLVMPLHGNLSLKCSPEGYVRLYIYFWDMEKHTESSNDWANLNTLSNS